MIPQAAGNSRIFSGRCAESQKEGLRAHSLIPYFTFNIIRTLPMPLVHKTMQVPDIIGLKMASRRDGKALLSFIFAII